MTMFLDDLLASGKQIYIRNVHKPRCVIVLNLITAGGRSNREIIPNTKHPINLLNRVTPEMIRNSPELRRLIESGVLELVDPEVAVKELSDPGVIQEINDAYKNIGYQHSEVIKLREDNIKESNEKAISMLTAAGTENTEIKDMVAKLAMSSNSVEEAEEEEDAKVQVRVKIIVEGMKDMKAREARAALGALDLSIEDLQYIIANTGSGSLVNSYAKKQLSILLGTQDQDDEVIVEEEGISVKIQ